VIYEKDFVLLHSKSNNPGIRRFMTNEKITVEVCANSIESALAGQSGGAVRIELCDNLAEGGVTPSLETIRQAREALNIQLYVIIRPRGGNFVYDEAEFETMKQNIRLCGEVGCDGVVIGMLTPQGEVDIPRCAELVRLARTFSMSVTFHRAFDCCRDQFQSLDDIIRLGCDRILTSGGKNSAPEGAPVIRQLIEQAAGRVRIMPGAGITMDTIAELVRITGLKEFHGTFQSDYAGKFLTDVNKVKKVIQIANNTNEYETIL
jgi:copper homeostasis protein